MTSRIINPMFLEDGEMLNINWPRACLGRGERLLIHTGLHLLYVQRSLLPRGKSCPRDSLLNSNVPRMAEAPPADRYQDAQTLTGIREGLVQWSEAFPPSTRSARGLPQACLFVLEPVLLPPNAPMLLCTRRP